jgi:hypothetical protein
MRKTETRKTDRQTDSETENIKTVRQTDRKMDGRTDVMPVQKDKQVDMQTGRKTETSRHNDFHRYNRLLPSTASIPVHLVRRGRHPLFPK